MDEHQQSLLSNHISQAGDGSEKEPDDGALSFESAMYENPWLQGPMYQETNEGEQGSQGGELEIPAEEVIGEELQEAPDLIKTLEQEVEDEVHEISQLSIVEKPTSTSMAKGKRRRRLSQLARPKTNWQSVKDRPSVYWTERFLEDTTLTITVPAVSCRVEELARPRRFYLEYYNNNRTTPIWPISRPTLEYNASNRLKELAVPKVRNNIWSINMSEVSQVSRAARLAVPSPRILRLAKPRAPATLLKEWNPLPKPKPHVSDYNRLLQLAMPKVQSDKCVPDRSPRWEVLDVTKKAVATPRIISLAKPRVRKDLNESYDPYYISPASLVARASPRLYELATPKSITKKL
uniref:Testicular haploid expressed gene protein n=1 Tax=Castor canadensis TaxID=51338 RepID=A0A8C0X5L7_CASCN